MSVIALSWASAGLRLIRKCFAPLAFVLLAAAAVYLTGNAGYDVADVLMGVARLMALLVWAWVSGALIDAAHGVSFKDDRKLITDGNLAVALSRSLGHAVIFIPGAMLIAKI